MIRFYVCESNSDSCSLVVVAVFLFLNDLVLVLYFPRKRKPARAQRICMGVLFPWILSGQSFHILTPACPWGCNEIPTRRSLQL